MVLSVARSRLAIVSILALLTLGALSPAIAAPQEDAAGSPELLLEYDRYSVAGLLSLGAGLDIHNFVQRREEPVIVRRTWTDHLWALLPLGLLALPFLWRRNRTPGAALVLMPALAMYFLWVPLELRFGGGTGDLDLEVGTCAVGLGVLCLSLPWVATGGRWWTLARALVVVAVAEGLALFCFTRGTFAVSSLQLPSLVMPVVGSAILTTSVLLAAHSCRRSFEVSRFLLFQAIWLAVITPAAVAVILILRGSTGAQSSSHYIYMGLASSVVFAAMCFALGLPFLLLGVVSRTYRARFRAVSR